MYIHIFKNLTQVLNMYIHTGQHWSQRKSHPHTSPKGSCGKACHLCLVWLAIDREVLFVVNSLEANIFLSPIPY